MSAVSSDEFRAGLEHSYGMAVRYDGGTSRLAYLGEYIFDFTTYDDEMSELFARKAVEVCAAISDRRTFDYISDEENHRWYLLMVNMPFFAGRLDWGTSIRGAWWNNEPQALETCGLWRGDEQVTTWRFSREEWVAFIAAIVEFALEQKTRPDGEVR